MYATVTRDGTGRIIVHGPHGQPPATTPNGRAITVAICPPDAADRTTGTLTHPYQYAAGPALAAIPVSAPTAASVDDLNAPTVAVCIHPLSHRLFVVGPFTGPDRAEQWWHARTNRFADSGAHCHILALTTPDTVEAAPISGGDA